MVTADALTSYVLVEIIAGNLCRIIITVFKLAWHHLDISTGCHNLLTSMFSTRLRPRLKKLDSRVNSYRTEIGRSYLLSDTGCSEWQKRVLTLCHKKGCFDSWCISTLKVIERDDDFYMKFYVEHSLKMFNTHCPGDNGRTYHDWQKISMMNCSIKNLDSYELSPVVTMAA